MSKQKLFVIWSQEKEFSPVRRRAFILADSYKTANRKAVKAGIRGIVDIWEVYPNEISAISTTLLKSLGKRQVIKLS